MRWIENVRLRATEYIVDDLISEISAHLQKPKDLPGLLRASFYTNAALPGDLTITFVWETMQSNVWGSESGQLLSRYLKRFGLVDHTIWIEKISVEKVEINIRRPGKSIRQTG